MIAGRKPADDAPSLVPGDGRPGWTGRLIGLAKANGVFAVSEICKGVAIVTIGDMVIADELGELIGAVALTMGAFFPGQ